MTLVSQIVDTKYGRFFKAGIVVDKASCVFVFGMCDHDQKWISAERIVLQDATIKSISMVWYGMVPPGQLPLQLRPAFPKN